MSRRWERERDTVLRLARRAYNSGRWQSAIAHYERAVRIDPHDVHAFLKLGELYQRVGDISRAIQAFRSATEIYKCRGFYLKSIVVYKQILQLDATQIDIHVKLAELYHQLGLVTDAIAHLDHILQEQPNHEEAQHLRDELMGSPPRRLEVIEGEPFEVCTSGDGLFNTVGDRDNEPTAASPNADAPKDAAGGVQDHSERSSVPPSDAPTCDGTCDDCGCFSRDTPDED